MNVMREGTVLLMPSASGDQEAGEVYDKVSGPASAVKEYTSAMDWEPPLEAAGLDKTDGYRLLADFNGVVLAGQELEKGWGYQFATWVRSPDRTGVAHGNYYWDDFAGAKLSFAGRSGLVQTARLFTDEQLTGLYLCRITFWRRALSRPPSRWTPFFLSPNIEYACASGMSFLCTDTKGDLFRNYAGIARDCYGFHIAILDLRNPTRSDGNNLPHLINKYMDVYKADPQNLSAKAKAEKYAKILSKTLINTSGGDGTQCGQNVFFYDSAEGLLTAMFLLVAECLSDEDEDWNPCYRRHIVSVFKLVRELLAPSKAKGKNQFQFLIDKLPPNHKARWFAGAALNSADQAMASVLSTVLSRLNTFLDSEMELMFSASRSRRLMLVPIVQSITGQLQKNYGKESSEIIVDNCQLNIFGGFAPASQTAVEMSKALGSRTVMSGSISRGKNDPSQSLQMMERPLMTPDELKTTPKGEFIIMKTGGTPHQDKTAPLPGLGHSVPHALRGAGAGPAARGLRRQAGIRGGHHPQYHPRLF